MLQENPLLLLHMKEENEKVGGEDLHTMISAFAPRAGRLRRRFYLLLCNPPKRCHWRSPSACLLLVRRTSPLGRWVGTSCCLSHTLSWSPLAAGWGQGSCLLPWWWPRWWHLVCSVGCLGWFHHTWMWYLGMWSGSKQSSLLTLGSPGIYWCNSFGSWWTPSQVHVPSAESGTDFSRAVWEFVSQLQREERGLICVCWNLWTLQKVSRIIFKE